MKIALGYLRRSKKSDAKTVSLLEQQRQVERYCKEHSFDLVGVIEDDGVSGAKRSRWPRILSAIIEKRARVLVVYNQDRLARDNAGLMDNLRQLTDSGIEVHDVSAGLMDIGKSVPKLMVQMRGAFDEFYRDVIREKTTDALRYRKDNHQRWNCNAPFGWQWSEGKLATCPAEQRALRMIQENAHLGARKLVRLIATPGYEGRISVSTVHRILGKMRKANSHDKKQVSA